MKVLTVDFGATSGRFMVVSLTNERINYEEVHRFENIILKEDGELRWDFSNILNHLRIGIKKAFQMYSDISSIGIDTWGVDYGILKKNGELLRNPRCYRDSHMGEIVDEVLKKVSYQEIYQETGIQKLDFNTIFQLYLDREVLKSADQILLIPDLIAYYLTGKKRCELTNCSTTALYNPKDKKISEKLLSAIGVSKDLFAEMIVPGEIYGLLKKEYLVEGYPDVPVVCVCSHDTASAVVASCVSSNRLYLSSGTWSLMGAELSFPIINEESLFLNFSNEIGYQHSVRFLKNIMGMFLMNEVRKDLSLQGIQIKVADIAHLVEQAGENHSYLDPDDPLFATPQNMCQKVALYLEKTHQPPVSNPGAILKMIYESMALKYRYVFENISRFSANHYEELMVIGGGNQSVVLNQYTANALGIRVRKGCVEATVVGNAIVQFLSKGIIHSLEEARKMVQQSIDEIVYIPTNQKEWDKKYQVFLEKTNLK